MDTSPGECPFRLARLSLPARLMVTLFLALIGSGYLVAAYKIYVWHQDADGREGMTINDLRAVYHGIEMRITEDAAPIVHKSEMLEEVSEGGAMRQFLAKGGEPAIRTLIGWLETGAKEETFTQGSLYHEGDPSPQQVIASQCLKCHHADGGDAEDIPYAQDALSTPTYALVAKVAAPHIEEVDGETRIVRIGPTSFRELLHVTHAHILSIPVFALIVGSLFLLTSFSSRVKLVLVPLPMLALCVDFASWWLARSIEPFIYLIAAAGSVFAVGLGLQILGVWGSMWFGRKSQEVRH
jgi:hypothetical protein